jgi:hypothetical protein
MNKQRLFTALGGALLFGGLVFSGPPSAHAGQGEPRAYGAPADQSGRNLRAGSVRQANRPLMQSLK